MGPVLFYKGPTSTVGGPLHGQKGTPKQLPPCTHTSGQPSFVAFHRSLPSPVLYPTPTLLLSFVMLMMHYSVSFASLASPRPPKTYIFTTFWILAALRLPVLLTSFGLSHAHRLAFREIIYIYIYCIRMYINRTSSFLLLMDSTKKLQCALLDCGVCSILLRISMPQLPLSYAEERRSCLKVVSS